MKKDPDIRIKTAAELATLRDAGKILARIVGSIKSSLKIGMMTRDIDLEAERLMRQEGVRAAFKGYHGFPASVCVSVNEEVVHGIPGERVIRDNDIVSIDIGIIHQGYFSDMAVTVGFGALDAARQKLLDVTRQALYKGIAEAHSGARLGDLSHAIQAYVESKGFSVVRDFVGHGIGRELHEDPEIPNYGEPGTGPVLKPGMVLAIEPMVNAGRYQTRTLPDRWTVVTADRRPSAHFEHTIAVTEGGPFILTE